MGDGCQGSGAGRGEREEGKRGKGKSNLTPDDYLLLPTDL